MAHHANPQLSDSDTRPLGNHAFSLCLYPLLAGLVGLALAGLVALMSDRGLERFAHSYLWAFSYVATFIFGFTALLFITTLFRGGWQVVMRRIWEVYAMAWGPLMIVLAIPLVLFAARSDGLLYSWNLPAFDAQGHPTGQLQHTHQLPVTDDPEVIAKLVDEGLVSEGATVTTVPNYFVDRPDAFEYLKSLQHQPAPYTEGSLGAPDHQAHGDHGEHGSDGSHHGEEHHDSPYGEEQDQDQDQNDAAHGEDHAVHDVTIQIIPTAAGGDAHGDDHDAHAHNNPLIEDKLPYLNVPFWSLRLFSYLFVMWGLVYLFFKTSTSQDKLDLTDPEQAETCKAMTRRVEKCSAPWTAIFGCVITFFAIDVLMSLDPTWYSTMFGIRYFAGSMIAALSLTVISLRVLQARGFMAAVNVEHYHDLGKLMFAFVIFWTYTSFSQYLLIWYAEVPGELPWYMVRGAGTVDGSGSAYSAVSILLLLGHFVFPFFFLLSRHIKRNLTLLTAGAVYLLLIHAVDLFWVVMPEFDNRAIFFNAGSVAIDLGCFVGLMGLFLSFSANLAARNALIPLKDPRLGMSIAHDNLY